MDKEAVGMSDAVTREQIEAWAKRAGIVGSGADGALTEPNIVRLGDFAIAAREGLLSVGALAQQPAAQAAGLTDAEIIAIYGEHYFDCVDEDDRDPSHILPYTRAIERALLSRAAPADKQGGGLTDEEIERLISRFIGPASASIRNDCRALVLEALTRAAPSAQQAEQPAMFGGGAQCSEVSSEHKAEQPAEEARGVNAMREALRKLIDAADDSDDSCHGTLSTTFVRDIAHAALLAAPAAGTGQFSEQASAWKITNPETGHVWFTEARTQALQQMQSGKIVTGYGQAATGAQGLTDNQLDDIWHSTEEIAGTAFGMHRKFARAVLAKAAPSALSAAARDVLAERQRQIEVEGWTPEHDDEHTDGGLAYAAACYAMAVDWDEEDGTPEHWPWAPHAWNPKDERCNLVRAGALIQAEIERLDRAGLAASKEGA